MYVSSLSEAPFPSLFNNSLAVVCASFLDLRAGRGFLIAMQNATSSAIVMGGMLGWTIGGGFAGWFASLQGVYARDHLETGGDAFVRKAYKREILEYELQWRRYLIQSSCNISRF
jgi:hypothetical protein